MLLLFALVAGSSSAWADTVTDELTQSWTGISGTNYSTWSGKTSTSDAVYAGNSAGGNNSIQLRSSNSNSGVVTTTSGGKAKKITVAWNSNTTSGRTLNVYGKNSAYSAATDLYNANNQGTLIGTIVCGTTTSLTITDDYEYIGFRSASGAMYLDKVEIVWEPESASAAPTTTTIDASDITNTDVFVNTAAGSLSASVTVTEGGAAVGGATVTWSSSDEDVATIADNGTVTLVAAGTVTFTATYAGVTDTYASSYATYEMTVTSSAPYVQPTEFDIALNNSLFGTSYTGTASGITDDNPESGSQDNVTVTYAGSGNHYINDSQIRFYPSNKLTFEAPSGYNITKIVFTSAGTWAATIAADGGTYTSDTKTWTGEATSVVFTGSGSSRCDMSKATITLAKQSSVATPTFSPDGGTYDEAQNVMVDNYDSDYMYFYTTDGTTPDCDGSLNPEGTSQVYDDATGIDITATTTLKIVAVDIDGNKSNVASATYTIETPLATIAEVKAQANNSTVRVKLTDAQVVFVSGNDIYVRDATGAMDFYQSGISELETGDIFDATIEATYILYKGMPELKTFTSKTITKKGNSTVVAKTVTSASEVEANVCDLVKFESVQLTESNSKYYVGATGIQLYDKFSTGYTAETDKDVDVSGIVVPFGNTEPYTYEICPRFATDIVYLSNAEEVSIGAAGIATFCSEHALDFTGADAIAVYIAAASGDHVTLTQIHKVPANTGVILMNALGMNEGDVAAVNVPYLDGDADDVTGNELVGITEETVVNAMSSTKFNYILSNELDGIGFYKATDGIKLAAKKAYLSTTVDASVRGFLGFTDDSDAINEIVNGKSVNGTYYDLSGRRVSKATKGIYIVNGKKVVK